MGFTSRGGMAPLLLGAGLLLAGCGGTGGLRVPGLAANWSGQGPDFPSDSLTVQRVRQGLPADAGVLTVEPGNVWPEPEAARATLADPDAALRGLPRPTFPEPARLAPMDRIAPRADGRVLTTPDGQAVTTGGTERVQGTISPRGTGVAIRDGGNVTVIEPGTPPRLVPAPR